MDLLLLPGLSNKGKPYEMTIFLKMPLFAALEITISSCLQDSSPWQFLSWGGLIVWVS